ncbi:MAG: c-type cytochrome [Pirellulaceae bacterium]
MHSIQPVLLQSRWAAVFPWLALVMPNAACSQTTAEFERAGDRFENVSALGDMPADQMGKVMNMMSAALGVNCSYCHADTNFAQEQVGHKDVAREMLEMTLSINRERFGGKTTVTCHTCHRGQPVPNPSVSLATTCSFQRHLIVRGRC